MNKFKKTCFRCGNKVEKLFNSLCEECFKVEFPPIEEIKPIKVKYCNQCLSINYNNSKLTTEEFENKLPNIVKKNLILNNYYNLINIKINNFKIKGSKVYFEVEVNSELK